MPRELRRRRRTSSSRHQPPPHLRAKPFLLSVVLLTAVFTALRIEFAALRIELLGTPNPAARTRPTDWHTALLRRLSLLRLHRIRHDNGPNTTDHAAAWQLGASIQPVAGPDMLMVPWDKEDLLVMMHVPKTGGGSFYDRARAVTPGAQQWYPGGTGGKASFHAPGPWPQLEPPPSIS